MNEKTSGKLHLIDFIAAALVLLAFGNIIFRTPIERSMGMVQKVFYFHVACAWLGMLSFIFAALFSASYLKNRQIKLDIAAESAVEIGLVFTILAVLSGSIWAKPVWNTWWTWDPRLTTTTIMGFIYISYLFLRNSLENQDKMRKIAAVFCIIGGLSVPLTYFSIRGARSIHPVVIGSGASGMNMTPEMLQAMIFSVIAFTVFYIAVLLHRIELGKLDVEIEMLNQIWQEEEEND